MGRKTVKRNKRQKNKRCVKSRKTVNNKHGCRSKRRIQHQHGGLSVAAALGSKYEKAIIDTFGNFTDLLLINTRRIRTIGNNTRSINGFILLLPYVKNKYEAYTILKCSKSARADNFIL